MADEEEHECPECPAGLPAYLATFADLMSLLMCFFVLLLAFSEMDVKKYKQIAGSMSSAFGVQRTVEAVEVPKGTSVIAQEFSPGKPEPTPLQEVRQKTDDTKANLKRTEHDASGAANDQNRQESAKIMKKLVAQTQASAVKAAASLKVEIQQGKIEVETIGRTIIIRIKEQGSFASGSATLRPSFIPITDKIRETLKGMTGTFDITGHTDDMPISTRRFRSNWELASSRAVSVGHELMKTGELAPDRFAIVGLGDTKPLAENTNAENRAKNRRVEIVVQQGVDDEAILAGEKPLPEDSEFTADMILEAGLGGLEGFEIFEQTEPEAAKPQNNAESGAVKQSEFDNVSPTGNTAVEPKPEPQANARNKPQTTDATFDKPKVQRAAPTVKPAPADFDFTGDPFGEGKARDKAPSDAASEEFF